MFHFPIDSDTIDKNMNALARAACTAIASVVTVQDNNESVWNVNVFSSPVGVTKSNGMIAVNCLSWEEAWPMGVSGEVTEGTPEASK